MTMTVQEFIDEYEYLTAQGEYIDDPDVLKEVHTMVEGMFQDNCETVPKFELIEGGKKILLL